MCALSTVSVTSQSITIHMQNVGYYKMIVFTGDHISKMKSFTLTTAATSSGMCYGTD